MSETLNYEVMAVDPPLADQVERWCKASPEHDENDPILFEEEVHFLDKHFMVVQVVSAESSAWTHGILFDEQGRSCGSTTRTEEFLGTYQVGNYCVTVEKEDG